jgi:hypothetical protein
MTEPVVFTARGGGGLLPIIVGVGALVFVVGGLIIWQRWRTTGSLPLGLVAACIGALLLDAGFALRSLSNRPRLEVLADRIVTPEGPLTFGEIHSLVVRNDAQVVYIRGQPVASSRRILVAGTDGGERVVASDAMYDVEAVERALRERVPGLPR